jgi:hypothetical protein
MKNENNMLYDHPMIFAQGLAKMLRADRIATAQIKEHISQEELIEILGIEPEVITETEIEYHKHDNVADAVDSFSDDEVLRFIKKRFTRSEILELVA